MKRSATILIVILFSVTSAFAQSEPIALFKKGEGGYKMYRIPSVIQAANGDVLAFCEARNGRGDTGEINLVMKRSSDGGKTWGDMQIVWADGTNTCGNPAPVVDRKSGRIIMVTTWNDGRDLEINIRANTSFDTRRVFCFHSDDNGVTWSTPEEITSEVKIPEWTWYATGPCHAIQLQKGPYSGRIVIPCDHAVAPEMTGGELGGRSFSHVIYSDDGGESWKIGGCPKAGNESTVAELRNGRLVINMRVDGSDVKQWMDNGRCRQVAISDDGGDTFGAPYFDAALPEPRCQGSLVNYVRRGHNTNRLLFCNPASDKRENMWLKLSSDGGRRWRNVCCIHSGKAAYSDICVMEDGTVGVLYENGENSAYERISFVKVGAQDIKQASKNKLITR